MDTLKNKLDRIVELLTPIAAAAKMMSGNVKKETDNVKQTKDSKVAPVKKTEKTAKKATKKKSVKKKTAGKSL